MKKNYIEIFSIIITQISDFFGISEKKFQELADQKNFTIRTLKDFVSKECTQNFTYNDTMAYSRKSFNI